MTGGRLGEESAWRECPGSQSRRASVLFENGIAGKTVLEEALDMNRAEVRAAAGSSYVELELAL